LTIESSPGAWTSDSTEIQPDFEAHGALGFARGDDTGRKVLAVAVEGRFASAFSGQRSPLLPRPDEDGQGAADAGDTEQAGDTGEPGEAATAGADEGDPAGGDGAETPVISAVVDRSPASARLVLIGSSSFLTDTAISLASEATQSRYLKPLELVQNTLDWSLEDRGLLELRGRGQFSRLLDPVGREGRMFWEYLNYVLALGGLALVYLLHRVLRKRRERAYAAMLEG